MFLFKSHIFFYIYHNLNKEKDDPLELQQISNATISRSTWSNENVWIIWFQYVASIHLSKSLRWRYNGRDSVSNHQPHHCLLNRLFRRRSKKTSKLRVTGLCVGNSPGTGEFPAQMVSNAENVSIWWRHHVSCCYFPPVYFIRISIKTILVQTTNKTRIPIHINTPLTVYLSILVFWLSMGGQCPFYQHGIILIPAWISNAMHS